MTLPEIDHEYDEETLTVLTAESITDTMVFQNGNFAWHTYMFYGNTNNIEVNPVKRKVLITSGAISPRRRTIDLKDELSEEIKKLIRIDHGPAAEGIIECLVDLDAFISKHPLLQR